MPAAAPAREGETGRDVERRHPEPGPTGVRIRVWAVNYRRRAGEFSNKERVAVIGIRLPGRHRRARTHEISSGTLQGLGNESCSCRCDNRSRKMRWPASGPSSRSSVSHGDLEASTAVPTSRCVQDPLDRGSEFLSVRLPLMGARMAGCAGGHPCGPGDRGGHLLPSCPRPCRPGWGRSGGERPGRQGIVPPESVCWYR